MNKSKTDREKAEANYDRTQKKAKESAAALSEHDAQARAVDEKTIRLRALRLARDAAAAAAAPEEKFKPAPRRKAQPVKKVSLSAEAKQEYEALAQERDERQRTYGTHLPPDKAK